MATVNLGAIKFNWKGAYNNATAYVADDVVSSGGNSYVCILASTGNAVSNGTYWSLMAQAGTNGSNGTDVGTTITTQGDILYRDGSGLQRLAKGTASQSLTMNSGATAPEWTTPSGGGAWNLIGTAEASSSASLTITGIDSTYDQYAIIGTDLYTSTTTSGARGYMRLGDSGGIDSGASDYSWGNFETYTVATGNYTQIDEHASTIQVLGNGASWKSSGGMMGGFNFILSNLTGYATISGHQQYVTNTDEGYICQVLGVRLSVITVDRVQFYPSTGTITSGRMTVWGIAHS